MKWWSWRRPAVGSGEAEEATREARRALLDAHNFTRRADAIGQEADKIRRRNHIAESLELVIRLRSAEQ